MVVFPRPTHPLPSMPLPPCTAWRSYTANGMQLPWQGRYFGILCRQTEVDKRTSKLPPAQCLIPCTTYSRSGGGGGRPCANLAMSAFGSMAVTSPLARHSSDPRFGDGSRNVSLNSVRPTMITTKVQSVSGTSRRSCASPPASAMCELVCDGRREPTTTAREVDEESSLSGRFCRGNAQAAIEKSKRDDR